MINQSFSQDNDKKHNDNKMADMPIPGYYSSYDTTRRRRDTKEAEALASDPRGVYRYDNSEGLRKYMERSETRSNRYGRAPNTTGCNECDA